MTEYTPQRVLMTGDTVGGVWTFTLELASQLSAQGAEVWLVTFGGVASADQRRRANAISGLRLWDSDLKLEWMENPWKDVQESCAILWKLAREFQPDVAHLNTYAHAALPWECPVVVTAHSCVLSWWAAVKRTTLAPCWYRYRDEVRQALITADLVTAPSRAMLRTLKQQYAVELPNTRVIANGVNPSGFQPGPKQEFILTAGRLWDEAKNVQALCAIASRLPWPLYLAGEVSNSNGRTTQWPGCRLLGQLSAESLAHWYSSAALYALPARYEPFGLSALEAALSGCALVLGDIPTLRELWDGAAVFVPPDDPDRLHDVLEDLIEDSERRMQVAARCRNRAQRFTAKRMGSEYLDAFRYVAANKVACAS
jgi:glycosyltransferase involved in cell wall biosynthesis